ncbi:MAG: ASKHA domain-containing protein [Candidatus Methanofastidiosia archaeon]|jgi:uncharacterized 2Fe-2S/4Fe-4S cluster protein (DUF4445 family)
MTTHRITFQPSGRRISCESGLTVLDAARNAGIPLRAECGGKGLCGKCKIKVSGYPDYTQKEKEFLTPEELQDGYRLACQVYVTTNVTVEIPESSLLQKQRILIDGVNRKINLDPNVKKIFLKLPDPTLKDNRADIERIRDSVDHLITRINMDTLKQIPFVLRESDYEVTLVFLGEELAGCEKGDTSHMNYGVAIDIGTTTVVGYLLDLNTGEQVAVCAKMNPQISFGDDVISRINYGRTRKGLDKLNMCLRVCLLEIIDTLSETAKIPREHIYELSIAGNTCMHHLFLGVSPQGLAVAPYTPVVKEALSVRSDLYGKRMYVLPVIAGYVGADTVADIISYPLDDEVRLIIDIGTNCEIVLGTKDRMLACSAAAGPAFEGSHIKYGMRAAPGAIEKVAINDEVVVETIDDEEAKGIAGSGLISATAEMLRHGIMDPSGRLRTEHEFSSRIKDNAFMLTDSISLTQKDLREVQLAKGAIFAAQKILLETYKIIFSDLKELVLAGAFGSYIPDESAKMIGLIFDLPAEKIKSIGNAAGAGAKLCLLSKKEREKAREISEEVEYVALSARKDFQKEFTDAMFFPHSNLELFPSVKKILAKTSPYFE